MASDRFDRFLPAIHEAARFFGVSLLGVIIDVAIAYALAMIFGFPLWVAAICGFVVAASANYAVHEVWTFRGGARQLSGARATNYLGASLVTLLVRIAVVAALEQALDGQYALLVLACGAGASFFVNFSLSKFLVFRVSTRAD